MDGVQSNVRIQETSELVKLRLPAAFVSDNLHREISVCTFLLSALLGGGAENGRRWKYKLKKSKEIKHWNL